MASTLDVLTAISNCWCDVLADTILGAPAQCCLTTYPNVVSCCDGQAWVRVTGAYPSKIFPIPYTTPDKCRVDNWALQVEIGVARCAPKPCAVTGPICCVEDAVAVQGQISDFEAMRRLWSCCLSVVAQDEIIVGQYRTEVTGGCSYATMQATIRISDFCAC